MSTLVSEISYSDSLYRYYLAPYVLDKKLIYDIMKSFRRLRFPRDKGEAKVRWGPG